MPLRRSTELTPRQEVTRSGAVLAVFLASALLAAGTAVVRAIVGGSGKKWHP